MRKPGRPEGQKFTGDRIAVRMTPELVERLDEMRRREADVPNRSEMLRRLVKRHEPKTATD